MPYVVMYKVQNSTLSVQRLKWKCVWWQYYAKLTSYPWMRHEELCLGAWKESSLPRTVTFSGTFGGNMVISNTLKKQINSGRGILKMLSETHYWYQCWSLVGCSKGFRLYGLWLRKLKLCKFQNDYLKLTGIKITLRKVWVNNNVVVSNIFPQIASSSRAQNLFENMLEVSFLFLSSKHFERKKLNCLTDGTHLLNKFPLETFVSIWSLIACLLMLIKLDDFLSNQRTQKRCKHLIELLSPTFTWAAKLVIAAKIMPVFSLLPWMQNSLNEIWCRSWQYLTCQVSLLPSWASLQSRDFLTQWLYQGTDILASLAETPKQVSLPR